eukprot:CAMPEP_0194327154 /NCGR_PEP_ID=MMETSP0171-20130528/39840_1 /TAXON_ID=218684 /ORGANISM="Corethron pennatum, Strain L29A3" /LENGTH=453 /DNA_ID=CAMNT_0039087001 /DNA_START=10 /DNA_END=1368 /DNA_ORIENTATION=-
MIRRSKGALPLDKGTIIPLTRQSKQETITKRRSSTGACGGFYIYGSVLCYIVVCIVLITTIFSTNESDASTAGAGKSTPNEQHNTINGIKGTIRAAPTDRIVETLSALARLPPAELRAMLADATKDPFRLEALKSGECPSRHWFEEVSVVDWLPTRRMPQISQWFKTRNDKNDKEHRPVAVYYEHLSKAGGTSFCKLAQSNMPRKEVPDYYCMPSERGKIDARIGSWKVEKVKKYFQQQTKRLVSNEWEPFNLDFLALQPKSEADLSGGKDGDILLMFVTSIRDPINRLLSAHKFWNGRDLSLELYLEEKSRHASQWTIGSEDFLGNVGRFNFATWKFSGGTLPVNKKQFKAEKLLSKAKQRPGTVDFSTPESDWQKPFETAVRTLARFDLAIPMELMSDNRRPLTDMLGWDNFEKVHVVNMGVVQNSNAANVLPAGEFDALWDANSLDMILF